MIELEPMTIEIISKDDMKGIALKDRDKHVEIISNKKEKIDNKYDRLSTILDNISTISKCNERTKVVR